MLCDRLAGGEFAVLQSSRDVTSVSFSPDGEYVAVLSRLEMLLHAYRTRDGKCVFADRSDSRKSNLRWGGFPSEQSILAYGMEEGTVRIVRMRDVDTED